MTEQTLSSCDLVMQGGITSGIVYPPVVLGLKDVYTFRSIGGSSAGAIAAAETAAAEYNRAGGGFQTLDQISKKLGQDDNLLKLFQASAETQIALDILLEALKLRQATSEQNTSSHSPRTSSQAHNASPAPFFLRLFRLFVPRLPASMPGMISNLRERWKATHPDFLRAGRLGAIWGAIAGLLLALLLSFALLGVVSLVHVQTHEAAISILLIAFFISGLCLLLFIGGAGLWLGYLVNVLLSFVRLFNQGLADNFYGICSGHTSVPDAQNPLTNLTDWLSASLDKTAGIADSGAPLTFGDLQGKEIDLQMVTSNLSHCRPYIVPSELQNFLFKESDMQRLFPAYVVEQLKTSPQSTLVPPELLPAGYHFLPDAADLPVIFGARLSLSFPLLLSAVPLYTISSTAYTAYQNKELQGKFDPARHLQCNWFSDGGICSNFPIQFFDAWLPDRPTFGINLTATDQESSAVVTRDASVAPEHRKEKAVHKDMHVPGGSVYLPGAEEILDVDWTPLDSLPQVCQAIFGIAQNYRDTLQTQLPSYRERVIQIRLDKDEGGLNLTMTPQTIQHVVSKGQEAGQILQHFDFEQHWWVRFLVLMARLEENMEEIETMFARTRFDFVHPSAFEERLFREWNSISDQQHTYPYYRDKDWCDEALRRVKALQSLIDNWRKANHRLDVQQFFQYDAPKPDTVLRVTSNI